MSSDRPKIIGDEVTRSQFEEYVNGLQHEQVIALSDVCRERLVKDYIGAPPVKSATNASQTVLPKASDQAAGGKLKLPLPAITQGLVMGKGRVPPQEIARQPVAAVTQLPKTPGSWNETMVDRLYLLRRKGILKTEIHFEYCQVLRGRHLVWEATTEIYTPDLLNKTNPKPVASIWTGYGKTKSEAQEEACRQAVEALDDLYR